MTVRHAVVIIAVCAAALFGCSKRDSRGDAYADDDYGRYRETWIDDDCCMPMPRRAPRYREYYRPDDFGPPLRCRYDRCGDCRACAQWDECGPCRYGVRRVWTDPCRRRCPEVRCRSFCREWYDWEDARSERRSFPPPPDAYSE